MSKADAYDAMVAAVDAAHDAMVVAADAAYAAYSDYDTYEAVRKLICKYEAGRDKCWPTVEKAKAAGRYLYVLARLELL